MKFTLIFTLFLFTCLACATTENSMTEDPHSFSNPDEVKLNHLVWTAKIDFSEKIINAIAVWEIENVSGAEKLILDTKELSINKILDTDGNPLNFISGPPDAILGQSLEISLLPTTKTIAIHYKTSPNAEALQWLEPEQT